MAWWIPLIQMAAQMNQQNNEQQSRLYAPRFSGGSSYSRNKYVPPEEDSMGLGSTSSLLASVFGVGKKKEEKPDIFNQLDYIKRTGAASRISLDDNTIGGAFYDL
jgi:hypothetical protein